MLAALACVALAPQAGAAVYWGNFGTNTIGGANLDGSMVTQSFVPAGGPGGVAVDGQHVYWTNFGGTTIGRANLDGSGVDQNFIPTAGGAFGIAVDGQHIYWANNSQGSIGRADLDGGNVDNSFIPGATDPEGVAVDGSHIYWGNYGAGMIGRANLNGSGPQQNFVTGADGPTGIALDGQHIFWSNTNGNTVGRVDLDGISNKDPNFIPDPLALNTEGVAVFGGFIYWTRGNDPAGPGTIGRANLDGSNPNRDFITTGALWPFGVAVDGAPLGSAGGGGKSLKFGKVKLNKKKGTALLPVTVPSAGTLSLGGKGLVHKRLGQAPALGKLFKKVPKAGTYTLKVKAKGKKKAKLFSTGKVKVKAVITFKPTSGEAVHATHKIKLKKN
jgi:Low-density lipoprotein receptor repeat class B.